MLSCLDMSTLNDQNEPLDLPAREESPPGVPLWLILLAAGVVVFLIAFAGRHLIGGSMGHM